MKKMFGRLESNVELTGEQKLSAFRKVALGTWKTVGDPSVYSEIVFNVEPALEYLRKASELSSQKLTLTHFVGKACAETIRRHPELNSLLRWGTIYHRKNIDIFFQVATDTKGHDLSGTTVRQIDRKSIFEIAKDMQQKVKRIRDTGDVDYRQMKKTMKSLPPWLTGWILNISSYIMYTLNLWTPLLGVPKDSFGTMMITSIGSIGLDRAFVPLVPYARIPCLIAVGAMREAPIVEGGIVKVAKVVSLCVTFDHRVIDGMHASHMARTLRAIFENPEKELGDLSNQLFTPALSMDFIEGQKNEGELLLPEETSH